MTILGMFELCGFVVWISFTFRSFNNGFHLFSGIPKVKQTKERKRCRSDEVVLLDNGKLVPKNSGTMDFDSIEVAQLPLKFNLPVRKPRVPSVGLPFTPGDIYICTDQFLYFFFYLNWNGNIFQALLYQLQIILGCKKVALNYFPMFKAKQFFSMEMRRMIWLLPLLRVYALPKRRSKEMLC